MEIIHLGYSNDAHIVENSFVNVHCQSLILSSLHLKEDPP